MEDALAEVSRILLPVPQPNSDNASPKRRSTSSVTTHDDDVDAAALTPEEEPYRERVFSDSEHASLLREHRRHALGVVQRRRYERRSAEPEVRSARDTRLRSDPDHASSLPPSAAHDHLNQSHGSATSAFHLPGKRKRIKQALERIITPKIGRKHNKLLDLDDEMPFGSYSAPVSRPGTPVGYCSCHLV